MKTLLLIALLALGCSANQPPPTYSVGVGFDDAHAEVIRDVMAAWCSRVGYCPTEVASTDWGNFSMVSGGFIPEDPGACKGEGEGECKVDAHNQDGARVQMWEESPRIEDLDYFWVIMAHEVGHYCIGDHTKTGLMRAQHQPGDDKMEIDDVAASAWMSGCS